MKNFFLLTTVVLVLSACGPAAEDRAKSEARNKILQDSMQNVIKSQINEVENDFKNAPQPLQPAPADTSKKAK
jgi:outer membrane biogenesis lipoprotein LolB